MEPKWQRNSISRKRIGTVLSLIGLVFTGWALWSVLQGPPPGETQQAGGVGRVPLQPVPCALPALLEDLRAGVRDGSPVYRKYLRETFIRAAVAAAVASPIQELPLLFAQEREAAVLEVVAMAIVTHAGVAEDVNLLRPLLDRLARETAPPSRAALVRALARTRGPASTLLKQLDTLTYEELIRDPAPEVREAVVANLLAEDSVNPGFQDIPDNAIAVAARSADPQVGGRILEGISIRDASAESVDKVLVLLRSDQVPLRRGAAAALGTLGGAHARRAMDALATQYRIESDKNVRKKILEAVARLGLGSAVPILVSLRGIDSTLDAEIDIWIEALRLNRQQWAHLQQEKERLAQARGL